MCVCGRFGRRGVGKKCLWLCGGVFASNNCSVTALSLLFDGQITQLESWQSRGSCGMNFELSVNGANEQKRLQFLHVTWASPS